MIPILDDATNSVVELLTREAHVLFFGLTLSDNASFDGNFHASLVMISRDESHSDLIFNCIEFSAINFTAEANKLN